MDTYKLWVVNNRDLIRSLESLAHGAMWILPERFGNTEVAPEAVYALVGIVTCVNQQILSGYSLPCLVSMLRDAEAAVEVAAQRFVGDDRKWGFLAATEAAKAWVRFAAFKESGYSRMLLQGGEVQNEEADPRKEVAQTEIPCNGKSSKSLEAAAALSKNCGMMMPDLVGTTTKQQPNPSMTLEPSWENVWSWRRRLFVLGEALHIFRPLVYVLTINKFGIRSWTPWLVSLAVEVTSLGIHSHATRLNLSSAERGEMKRRKMMMCALYAVRDPFFTNYTRRHLEKAQRALNPVPCISLGKLVDLSEGVQSRYTYTSGS